MSSSSKAKNQSTADARVTRASKNAEGTPESTLDTSLEERIDHRFNKMERAIEAMAAAVAEIPNKISKKKRHRDDDDGAPSKKKKSKKSKEHKSSEPAACTTKQRSKKKSDSTTHASRTVTPPTSNEPPSAATCDATSDNTSVTSPQFPDPGVSSQHSTATLPPNQVNNVNKWDSWSATLLEAGALGTSHNTTRPLSTRDSVSADIQAQVKNILESTASHFSKGTRKPNNFPYEYVVRGEQRKVASPNSVTLAEHIWGIIEMIKDPLINNAIKPALLDHIDEIVEDCRDYDWATAVRRWSEEVFSLVAENRLPRGWLSSDKIQLLRISMSKISTARLQTARDPYKQKPQAAIGNTASDYWKAGPPCRAFNSSDGCDLQPGHMVNGRRVQHVCSYCFVSAAATFPHSEQSCRNKYRDRTHHF